MLHHALRMTHLTRAQRDTLFTLAVIGSICALHLPHQPVWCNLLMLSTLLWRSHIAVRSAALPRRLWCNLLMLLGVVGTIWTYHAFFVRDAGVTITLVLLCIKTLELRTQRDTHVLFLLGFFALLCNFLYTQSLPIAVAMVLSTLGLLTLLINSHLPVGRPPLWQAARTALWMALLGTPLTVLLFVFFPRVAPLWGVLSETQHSHMGLSNAMQVGHLASLALDRSIAMRIHFDGATPAQQDLYFRGPVLTHFDGQVWTPAAMTPELATPTNMGLEVSAPAVTYTVTQEPNQHNWLTLLDATQQAPALPGYQVYMQSDLQWRVNGTLDRVVRYQARSYTHFRYGPRTWDASMHEALQLPPGYNPRTQEWAMQMRQDPRYAHADDRTLVMTLMAELHNGGYTYTLEPGLFGRDSADTFWFDRKQGFCEHIASAFVVMLRALHIPARIVTGYQGGELNPIDNDWTVRQSDAHAWVEVWLTDQGWMRVDPTSLVAPQRTNSSQRLLAPSNLFGQALAVVNPHLLGTGRAVWDALNSRWNAWVLNYSQAQQVNLLQQIGFSAPNAQTLIQVLVAGLATISLIGVAWLYYLQQRQDPWLRLLLRARQQLLRVGLPPTPHTPQMPTRTLAQALRQYHAANNPDHNAKLQAIEDWLLRLEAWRYARTAVPASGRRASLGTLRREFHQLQWPRQLPQLPTHPDAP